MLYSHSSAAVQNWCKVVQHWKCMWLQHMGGWQASSVVSPECISSTLELGQRHLNRYSSGLVVLCNLLAKARSEHTTLFWQGTSLATLMWCGCHKLMALHPTMTNLLHYCTCWGLIFKWSCEKSQTTGSTWQDVWCHNIWEKGRSRIVSLFLHC